MTLPKWRAIFGYRGESRPEKSVTEHDIASISTDPSNPDVTSQILEAPTTQVELVPREPPAPPAAEPTPAAQLVSLTSHKSTIREEPEAVTPQSLWDRAYDNLRQKDDQLIDKYEELPSREPPPKNEYGLLGLLSFFFFVVFFI
ncbi:hypothetical protein NW759_017132 [Fusarium solani]|nr:hypothetical protein NW759_017132 [Fusarium solani]